MVKGLYISATNLNANQHKLEVISNNLANTNTTGFKRDDVEFESFNARLQRRVRGSVLPAELGVADAGIEAIDENEYSLQTKRGYFSFETPYGTHNTKAATVWIDDGGYVRSVYKTPSGQIDKRRGNYMLSNGKRVQIEGKPSLGKSGELNGQQVVKYYKPTDIGMISAGVSTFDVRTDFQQGNIVRTDNKTDFAIKGDGFFTVLGKDGQEYLTRDGVLTLNGSGELMNYSGDRLIGLNGSIVLENEEFAINRFGEVIVDGEIVDKVQMVSVPDKSDIYKVGSTHFKLREDSKENTEEFNGELISGHIEKSNVEAVSEMIKLIELNRNFESSQKVVSTIDEMLGKAVLEVGKA